MRKFIKNVLIFFLPIVLLALVSEVLLREIPKNYIEKREYLDANSSSLQVLLLGNSHTLDDINPDFIRKKSFNAAAPSQTYDLDLEIMRHYDSKWNSLEYIVLPVSSISLYEILSEGKEHWRVKNYVIYWNLAVSDKLEDHSEILGNKLWYSLYRMYQYYVLQESEKNCSPLGWIKNASANPEELDEISKEKAIQHSNIDRKINAESILRSIIEYAQKKNVRVILYTAPAYPSYVENMNKEQWEKALSVAYGVGNEYSNVFYYNFLSDKDFVPSDFFDGDHLSEKGSQKFTLKIDSILNCPLVK